MSICARGASLVSVAVAAGSVLLIAGAPQVTAAPATDGQGYVDSTARCNSPDTAVVYGTTSASRVAICKTPAGGYQYRGVRLRDGAKLVLAATASNGGFSATNDGITYVVSAGGLEVRTGSQVIREEPMVDFHGDLPKAPAPAAPGPVPAPAASPPPSATAATTPTPPLPPPLPAEVGG